MAPRRPATIARRRAAAALTGAVLLLAALPAPAPAAASGSLTLATPEFVARCPGTHRAPDDPIVFPRRPGRSHLHDFYGNRRTNAFSTAASLLRGPTSCVPSSDRSAYWAPTLFDRATIVRASRASFHYSTPPLTRRAVRPFPFGLRVIAGDQHRRVPGGPRIALWSCPLSGRPATQTIPTCPDGYGLGLTVRFPDCWNGRTLDSPDHQAHMAYRVAGRCPRTHPVAVPQLRVELRYRARGGPLFRLASGPGPSAHSDFFNAWVPSALSRLVATCLRGEGRCLGH